jgi:hypothetical protein
MNMMLKYLHKNSQIHLSPTNVPSGIIVDTIHVHFPGHVIHHGAHFFSNMTKHVIMLHVTVVTPGDARNEKEGR